MSVEKFVNSFEVVVGERDFGSDVIDALEHLDRGVVGVLLRGRGVVFDELVVLLKFFETLGVVVVFPRAEFPTLEVVDP